MANQKHLFRYYRLLLKVALLLVVTINLFALSQRNSPRRMKVKNGNIFVTLRDTIWASFPGGESAWTKYIVKKLNQHTDDLAISKDTGTTLVQFSVDEKGKLSGFEVLKKQNSFLALIVVDALKNGPEWIPATVDGKPIRCVRRQPVRFTLSH